MWSCQCTFAKAFKNYLHTFGAERVPDQAQIRCVTDHLANQPILETMCSPADQAAKVVEGSVSRVDQEEIKADDDNLVTILISVIIAIVVLVGGAFAICCCRGRIKTWLYNKSSEIYESSRASSMGGSSNNSSGGAA